MSFSIPEQAASFPVTASQSIYNHDSGLPVFLANSHSYAHYTYPSSLSNPNPVYLSPALALLTMYYIHPELALSPFDKISEQPVFEGRETIEMYECGDADQSVVEHATYCAGSEDNHRAEQSENTGVIVAVTLSSVLFVVVGVLAVVLFFIGRRSHQSPPSANHLQSSSTSPCDSTNKPSSSAPPSVTVPQPSTTATNNVVVANNI